MHPISYFEKNSMRKSYRTTMPLYLVIDQQSYRALDWSLTGAAIESLDMPFKPGEVIEAIILLKMPDATVSIPVKLRHIYTKEGRSGFAFENLSEKNKNVLRRFIELSIEGKIDNTDDVIAIYEEPGVETPVQSPVKLQDEEAKALKSSFLRASLRYILFGLVLLATFAVLLFYNLRYSFEGSGIVMGNDRKVYPMQSAIVSRLYVKEGTYVKKGDPLLQLDSSEIEYQLALLESQKEEALKRYESAKKRLADESTTPNLGLITLLKKSVATSYRELQNARKQFADGLITRDLLNRIERNYLDARTKLENAKVDAKVLRKKLGVSPQNLVAPDLQERDVRIAYLKKLLGQYRITAPVDGIVYEIYATEGQQALASNPVMALWVRRKPYIVVNVPNSYLADISEGTKVDIVDKKQKRSYTGVVTKTGSVDESPDAETFSVTIKPSVSLDTLAPHQRVEVLFRRDF